MSKLIKTKVIVIKSWLFPFLHQENPSFERNIENSTRWFLLPNYGQID